jgi:hypothetical protein
MGKVRPTIALLTDDIADDQVTSAKIADTTIVNADVNASAAIAKTKLASLDVVNADVNASAAIVQSKLATLAIDTAELVDNGVTLGKLEDGTQGDILYYGASGAPARLGFGTSGDFLKTQGTGANPAWATISAADNTPSFKAKLSVNQAIPTATWTKVQMNTEVWDTDGTYDNSTNYRFTVPVGSAGKYSFHLATQLNVDSGDYSAMYIFINGAEYSPSSNRLQATGWLSHVHQVSIVVELSEADYVEWFFAHNYGSDRDLNAAMSYFSGYKLAGV